MCSCLKESRLRERPGTSGKEGTFPCGDRPVFCPCLNWEGGAAWNDQNWYHAGDPGWSPRHRTAGTSRRSPGPPSTSPRRSPRLSLSGSTKDFRRLPLSAKSDRRKAHSLSASDDERGRHPSRSSRSSSDHGRSGQCQRSRSREPTPPQLPNFNIDDFTVVSPTTFTFTSVHPFFPGWVPTASGNCRARTMPRTNWR